MKRTRALILGVAAAAAVVVIGAISLSSVLARCAYSETKRSFSPDGKFYTQIQTTICRDNEKTYYRLVMGATDRKDMIVVLDLRSSLDEMHYNWREGPELQVSVPPAAIAKRYTEYGGWPRVVIQEQYLARP